MPDPSTGKLTTKHIALVTTSQPAANPRLSKEAEALATIGYKVTVLYCYMVNWGNEALFENRNLQWVQVGGCPDKKPWLWNLTRIKRKTFSTISKLAPQFMERSVCRAYDELIYAGNKLCADLYIAHTIGALPVVARMARKRHRPFGFDAEDFHRSESLNTSLNKIAETIENRYLPEASYLSVSSPLIAEEYRKIFPEQTIDCVVNVFRKRQQPLFRLSNFPGPLRLFWFSQTIGTDRGIEDVIEAMNILPDCKFELTILGAPRHQVVNRFFQLKKHKQHQIKILSNIPEDELILLSSGFDIGLALEKRIPYNRDICLTNKIFTYLIAGNAIIASETAAQKKFLKEYPDVGLSYPSGDIQTLARHLKFYYSNRQDLKKAREAAWRLANERLNWEEEQKKLLRLVGSVLK